jgi:hypothetical protein
MSERIEWELVPRVRPDQQDIVEEIANEILRLDGALEFGRSAVGEQDEERLLSLHARMANCLLPPCEAANTPLLNVRDRWQELAADAMATLPDYDGLDRESFLSFMGQQHDCSECEGKSHFGGVSGVLCEFDLTPLACILSQDELWEAAQFELTPVEMVGFAGEVESRRRTGSFVPLDQIDAESYLLEVVRYLRFWSNLGFGVAPVCVEAEQD